MSNNLIQPDHLKVTLQLTGYTYSLNGGAPQTQPPKIKPGSQVEFFNDTVKTLYIDSTDTRPCPFTEAWPTCIPRNATVLRKVWDTTLTAPIHFGFHAYDLIPDGVTTPPLTSANAVPIVGTPDDDGEVIVK